MLTLVTAAFFALQKRPVKRQRYRDNTTAQVLAGPIRHRTFGKRGAGQCHRVIAPTRQHPAAVHPATTVFQVLEAILGFHADDGGPDERIFAIEPAQQQPKHVGCNFCPEPMVFAARGRITCRCLQFQHQRLARPYIFFRIDNAPVYCGLSCRCTYIPDSRVELYT